MKKTTCFPNFGGSSWIKTLRIVKINVFILLFFLVQASASTYSQSVKLSLNLKNASVEQVIDEIESNSEFKFLYRTGQIDVTRRVNVDIKKSSLEEILEEVFEGTNVTSTFLNDNLVVLSDKSTNSEQQGIVKGKVTDSDGIPIPGVSVIVTGTTRGVSTNVDGEYSLEIPANAISLKFSFVGMLTQEVVIDNKSVIDIVLSSDALQVEEVVVTALGIKREKKALGYAMTSIKSEELVKSGIPINPLSSLYGKAAGVKISGTSNGPTGGMIINIRNSVSLSQSSSTRPLFVVDGVPIFDENTSASGYADRKRDTGTGINDINAEDIESLEILKGAKASVLYGYAGANGVVLISTKSGSKKKGLGVELNSSFTWDNIAYYPELQNEFGTGNTLGSSGRNPEDTDEQGFKYDDINGVRTPVYDGTGSAGFGPKFDGREILWWDGEMRPYEAQPNNYKGLFNTGHLRTNGFALTAGGDIGNVRFSYTNKKYESTSIGAYQDNHIVSFNGKLNISDKIKLGYVSNYYFTFNHNAPYRMQNGMVTYGINRDLRPDLLRKNITDETGIYWYFRDQDRYNAAGKDFGIAGKLSAGYFWNQTQNDIDETRHHFIQSANLQIELADWVDLTIQSGFDMTKRLNEDKFKLMRPLSEVAQQGRYKVATRDVINFYNHAYLNFNKAITEDFEISGLIGGVFQSNSVRSLESVTTNFLIENWFSLGNSTSDITSRGSGNRGSDLIYSVLGSAQLSYKNYLYLELQARQDWSSILPPSNNKFFYPGASISWIASDSFVLPSVIKFLKTRASFADVGRPGSRYFGNLNFNVSSYGGVPYANASSELPPADFATGIAEGKLPPENLKPERKREFEVGFEMNLFKDNRLGIDFSWFTNNIYDQIISLDVPKSSGVNAIRVNAGDVKNTGIELQITGKPIVTSNFEWKNTLNLAKFNTKILELSDGVTILPLWGVTGGKMVAEVGGEYGEIYVNAYKRDDNGNLIVGANGVYEFDKVNQKKVGKQLPDITGGFNSSFSYKNFFFDFDMDFQFGGTMISQSNMYLKGNGTGMESLQYRDEARGGLPYYINSDGAKLKLDSHSEAVPVDSKYDWIFHDGVILPGVKADGNPNDILLAAQQYYERAYWQSGMDMAEDVIYKSDYVALRRATLGYQLPKRILANTFLTQARISIFANNIAFLYKDVPNVTPESYSGTNEFSEASGMPGVRSIGCEIKLGF